MISMGSYITCENVHTHIYEVIIFSISRVLV